MKKFFLISSLAFILLSGCKPDDVIPKDTIKPTITLTPLPEGAVRGNVSIKGAAADNMSIAKVEIYIDGTLVKTLTDGIIDFVWDTKTVKDGAHIIKVVATDKEGNDIESTINVTVMNVLLEFTVPENYIVNDATTENDWWIFISSEDGTVWDTKRMANGTTYSFQPEKEYTDKTITASLYQYMGKPYMTAYIRTFVNLSFGKYRFNSILPVTTKPGVVGAAKVTITDQTDFNYFENLKVYPDMNSTISASESGLLFNFSLPKSEHNKVLIVNSVNPDKDRFAFFELAKDDDVKKSTTTDFNDMTYKEFVVPEGNTNVNYTYTGFIGGNSMYFVSEGFNLDEKSVFEYKYPAGLFDEVEFSVSVVNSDEIRGFQKRDKNFPTEMEMIDAQITNFTRTGNEIAYTASGNFDLAGFLAGNLDTKSWTYTYWITYLGDKASNKAIVPSLPDEIKKAHPETFDFSEMDGAVVLSDYSAFSSYKDFVTKTLQSETPIINDRAVYVEKFFPSPTGRVSNTKEQIQPEFFEIQKLGFK